MAQLKPILRSLQAAWKHMTREIAHVQHLKHLKKNT